VPLAQHLRSYSTFNDCQNSTPNSTLPQFDMRIQ
ncbi:MAG: hypothetical protein ACI9RO_001818, partial [Alteromonas macleodii]